MKQHLPGVAFVIAVVAAGAWLASSAGDSGSRNTADQTAHTLATTSSSSQVDSKIASVATLVNGLEERLRQQPDDGKGWLLLAKSYRHLDRMDEARNAYRKADELGHADATVAAQLFGLAVDSQ